MRDNRFKFAKQHNIKGYSYHAIPDRKYKKAKIQMFGNKGVVYGSIFDDYNSCDSIQNIIEDNNEKKTPEALILGDIS